MLEVVYHEAGLCFQQAVLYGGADPAHGKEDHPPATRNSQIAPAPANQLIVAPR